MDWVSSHMKLKADTYIKQRNITKQQNNTFGENTVEEFYVQTLVRPTVWSTFCCTATEWLILK